MSKQNISLAKFPARSIGRISPALIRGEHVPYPTGETLLHDLRRAEQRGDKAAADRIREQIQQRRKAKGLKT